MANKPQAGQKTDKEKRTRLNKIRKIERELKKHPKMSNNLAMMKHLDELKQKV